MVKRLPVYLAIAAAAALVAVAAEPPSGASIFDRYVRESGGERAIGRIDSFHVHGSYAFPGAGLEGTIDLHFAKPDKLRFVVDLPGFGVIRSGYDGKTAWKIDPQQGARVVQDAERDGVLNWVARAFSILPQPASVEAIGPAERVTFEEQDSWKVRLRLAPTGHTYDEYFDPATGLLLGRVEPLATGSGELRGKIDAYQTWHGLEVPATWTHQAAGQTWTATYTSMAVDNVDPTVFDLPAEIRALLEPPADS